MKLRCVISVFGIKRLSTVTNCLLGFSQIKETAAVMKCRRLHSDCPCRRKKRRVIKVFYSLIFVFL